MKSTAQASNIFDTLPIVDVVSHVSEPPDLWTARMSKKMSVTRRAAAAACVFSWASLTVADTTVHPMADEFDHPPPAARAPASCRTAQRYIDTINAGQYDRMATLFAADAVMLTPTGEVLHGRPQISAFYQHFLQKVRPKAIPISFIADGRECAMEAAAQLASGGETYRLQALDRFTFDAQGNIAHMVVYPRPGNLVEIRHALGLDKVTP
jgi:uncharacterized protein (TIGR02246 family)